MEINDFYQSVIKVALDLDFRRSEVISFLHFLSSKSPIKTGTLIRITGLPKSTLYRLLKSFSLYLEPPSRTLVVKPEIRESLQNFCRHELEIIRSVDQKSIKDILISYQNFRPSPNRNYDQFNATLNTTIKRAAKMAKVGDLYDREIALLGDDFTSVAIGLTKQAKRIVVFEIDDRITNLIIRIAKENKLNIQAVRHDLRKPISKEFLASFDTVFTDPPYTSDAISLFINRAVELIRKKYPSRIYLCYGNSDRARERELDIQGLLVEKGLLIHSKHFQFNKYHRAESIGSSSSLYLLDWTPKTKTTKINFNKLYTNE